jgi:hypothetical protein
LPQAAADLRRRWPVILPRVRCPGRLE